MFNMIKTAVIGASGYIGGHLIKKYRKTFPDCVGTSFSKSINGLIPFDLRNPNIQDLQLEETGHQSVIISSAMPNVSWCESNHAASYELNVKGTLNLIKQLGRTTLTTFFISSDYVFNGDVGAYLDTAMPNPNTQYGKQKAKVEQEISNLTKKYAVLRLSKIYGTTWKDGTLIDAMAAELLQNKRITAATDQFFSPTHVNDVVAMIIALQERDACGIINVCNSNVYSRFQIANKIAQALNMPSSLLHATNLHSIEGMQNRPLNTSLICSQFLEKEQSSFITLDEAVQQVALNWSPKRAS